MPDEFGGIEVVQEVDEFGGIPIEFTSISAKEKADAIKSQYPRMGRLAPQTGLQAITDPLSSLIYGASQAAGKLPGEIVQGGIGLGSIIERLNAASQGGMGMMPSQEDLQQLGIESPQLPIADISLQAAEPIYDLTPKIAELAGIPTNYPTSPQFRYPALAGLGEFGLNAAAALPGPTAAGVSKVGRTIVSPIAETRATARGMMRGTGTTPLFEKLNLSKTTREKAINAFGPTPIELSTGSFERNLVALPEIKEAATKPIRTFDTFEDASITAQKNLIAKSKDALAEADKMGLNPNSNNAYKAASDSLQNKGLTAEEVASVLDEFNKFEKTPNFVQTQKILVDVNGELGPLYRASREVAADKFSQARYSAKKSFRDALSENVDLGIKAATGIDDNPYQKYGMIGDLLDNGRYVWAQAEISTARRPAIGIPIPTSVGGAAKAGQAVGGFSKGRTNNFIRGLIEETPNLEKAPNLSSEARQELLNRFATPTAVADAPLANPALDFEQRIADLIATYPPKIRSDPGLARAAAIGQLRNK